MKTLTGNTEIEDKLDKLDKLTQEEARMASVELLKMTQSVDGKVKGVDHRVKGVDDRVKAIEERVQDVCDDVQDVRGDVHDVGIAIEGRVQDVDHKVQGVDHKLDQVDRSLSLQQLLIVSSAHTASQGINSEIAFHDGFHPQIHPSIIITHAKLITPVQLNGFFKELYSMNGNPPDPFCGYTENVRYSRPLPSVKS